MWNPFRYGHCDLPFDSFDLEAHDRLAQGGESFDYAQDREPVERLVEPFRVSRFEFRASPSHKLDQAYDFLRHIALPHFRMLNLRDGAPG